MKLYLAKHILPISSEPLQDAALLVHKDRIREIGKKEKLLEKYPKAEIVDCGDAVLLPGLINAHLHLELCHAPSYNALDFEDLSGEPNFVRWLIHLSEYQESLKPEEKRAAIQEGLKSIQKSGVTTLGDFTSYEGAFNCYEASKLRVMTYPEVMNLSRKTSQERFELALAFVDEILAADHPKIRAGLGPFAPYTLSKNLLKIFYQHLKQLGTSLQIHCSQSFAEMEFFYDSKGDIANLLFPYIGWGESLPPPHQKTPIQYLHSIDFLQIKPALVGCVHLGPTDLALIANSGSSIVYTPISNQTLKLGAFPLRKILSHKIPVGFGSEMKACNSHFSIWDEMKETLKIHSTETEPIQAEEIFKMATLGGAYNLGLAKEIGSLEKGKLADFLVIALKETPTEDLYTHLLTKSGPHQIEKILVGGEEV